MVEGSVWPLLLVATLVTYSWRALGVLVAGRIDPDGPVFEWVGCVAYALLAGLTVRMILLPIGALRGTDLGCRLVATALAIIVLRRSGGNIALGVLVGVGALVGLTAAGIKIWN
ncbi:MAG: AzlD domain-containing protein [Rhodospirillaceae bacterium]